ncbi:MAG: flagellar basal body protein [Rickettsiales bacterium]|nr:flagellar basal body protein [Rickettsiales bacterium]
MMKTKMGYLAEKQDVLSHNVANIDTPGYNAREMKELDFKRLASVYSNKLKMRMTSASHSIGTPRMPDDFRDQRDRETFETTPVENNIVLEEQMAKISETNMDYQKTTNLYKKTTALFKTAIGNK